MEASTAFELRLHFQGQVLNIVFFFLPIKFERLWLDPPWILDFVHDAYALRLSLLPFRLTSLCHCVAFRPLFTCPFALVERFRRYSWQYLDQHQQLSSLLLVTSCLLDVDDIHHKYIGALGDCEYVSSNRLKLSEIPSLNQTFVR